MKNQRVLKNRGKKMANPSNSSSHKKKSKANKKYKITKVADCCYYYGPYDYYCYFFSYF